MKITRRQLKRIIKEEVSNMLREQEIDKDPGPPSLVDVTARELQRLYDFHGGWPPFEGEVPYQDNPFMGTDEEAQQIYDFIGDLYTRQEKEDARRREHGSTRRAVHAAGLGVERALDAAAQAAGSASREREEL